MEAPKITQLNPYLTFDGNCEEAINYYQSILGGTIVDKNTFGGGPMEVADDQKDKIMHIHYSFDGVNILASDTGGQAPVKVGNNVHLSIYIPDKARATKIFNALSEGGTTTMPFEAVFWGGNFGSIVDKFGICWMVSCS